MSHAHHRGHKHHSITYQRLAAFFFLSFGAIEVAVGTGGVLSSALLVDGAHNGLDGAGFFAQSKGAEYSQLEEYSAKRCYWAPRIPRWVARVTAIAAIATGAAALPHIWHPESVNRWVLFSLGLVSCVANYWLGQLMHTHEEDIHEGNTAAGVIHLFSDAATSLLVVAAAILIAMTGLTVFDPIMAVAGSVLLVAANSYIDVRQREAIQAHKSPDHVHPRRDRAHVH